MAILFEAIQDPYGLREGLGNLAQSLSKKRLLEDQNRIMQTQDSKTRQRQINTLMSYLQDMPDEESSNLLQLIKSQGESGVDPSYALDLLKSRPRDKKSTQSEPKISPFEKKIQEKKANYLMESIDAAQELESQSGILDELENLTEKVSGITGYGKALLNTESASNFNSLGLAAIKPVLKIFNPVGSIPQLKINMVQKLYAPSAYDTTSSIKGKIASLRKILQYGKNKRDRLVQLFDEYGENIPYSELLKFSKDSEKIIDEALNATEEGRKLLNNLDKNNKEDVTTVDKSENSQEQSFSKPTQALARQNNGKIIENKKTGEKLISNGSRWIKYSG